MNYKKTGKMEKKFLLISSIFLFVVLFSIVNVQATVPISNLPISIPLNCGESYYNSFQLTGENIIVTPKALSSTFTGYTMGVTYHPASKIIYILFSQTSACSLGNATFSFEISTDGVPITKSIILEVSEDLWDLGTIAVNKGKRIDIGTIAHIGILEISDTSVQYLLSGCGTTDQGLLNEGDTLKRICSGEEIEIKLEKSYGTPFDFAEFKIFSSESGLILTSTNETEGVDSSECVLGIDTLGATVKRGSVFAFNTINANSGKYESGVIVNVLDQAGDLTPLSGTSDNTGFFSKRIHEDYKQDLLIKLFKEGCEPTNKVILFEQSYDDYISTKAEEEGAYQLVLNMSAKYEMKAISGTIKNSLDEVMGEVEVKITKPDNTVLTVQTNAKGVFSFTPIAIGVYKLQGGKDDYKSTELVSIEVYQNKQYLIVIKVNGEQKSEYKKGDRLSFELRNENNTLLPLTVDATFAGLPLRFISGISDSVTFEDTTTLVIAATEGYTLQQLQLIAKETNWKNLFYWGGIVVGLIILLFIILLIIKKTKGGSGKAPREMEIQLGGGE